MDPFSLPSSNLCQTVALTQAARQSLHREAVALRHQAEREVLNRFWGIAAGLGCRVLRAGRAQGAQPTEAPAPASSTC